jgi:hypothetical protein
VKIIATIIITVAMIIGIVVIVHTVMDNNHGSQVLAVYDKCLNERSDGGNCQRLRQDCANGDPYACHLVNVLACVIQSGSGCPND